MILNHLIKIFLVSNYYTVIQIYIIFWISLVGANLFHSRQIALILLRSPQSVGWSDTLDLPVNSIFV